MKRLRKIMLLVIGYLLSTINYLYAQPSTEAAMLESVSGTVQVQKRDKDEKEAAKIGTILIPGDQISTAENSEASLRLADGSMLWIKENTEFTIDKLVFEQTSKSRSSLFSLLLGKIKARIKKLKEKDVFQLKTPSAVLSVRGTEFELDVTEEKITTLKTFVGIVGIREISGIGEEILCEAGKQVSVSPGQPAEEPEPIKEKVEVPEEKAAEPEVEKEVEIPEAPEEKKEEKAPEKEVKVPEAPPEEKPKKPSKAVSGLNMAGNFGAEVLIDPETGQSRVYYKFNLQPELTIGKLGIGLDLVIYFDEENKTRGEEWDEWSDALEKIWYIRWAKKGAPFYAWLGGFSSLTLGHGLIMNRYTNMLWWPEYKKIGTEIGIDMGRIGLEALVTDLDRADVYGGRIYFRPFYTSKLFLFNKLALGVSAVTDRNPDEVKATEDDEVTVYGVDVELPLINFAGFSALAFADGAQMDLGDVYLSTDIASPKNKGKGYAYGLKGNILKLISWRGEYRKHEANFIPGYFSSYYDLEKTSKPYTIASDKEPMIEGPYAEIGVNLFQAIKLGFTYEDYNLDPLDLYPWWHGKLTVSPSLLQNFELSGSYEKRNCKKWTEIKKLEGAVVSLEISWQAKPGLWITMIQRQRFDAQGNPHKNTAFQTRLQF